MDSAPCGGALNVLGPVTVTLMHATFVQNRAEHGGAVSAENIRNLTTGNCTWAANRAVSNGGALFISGAALETTLHDSIFTFNSGSTGGSVYVAGVSSVVTLHNLNVSESTAQQSGGGIFALNVSLEVTQSTFTGNSVGENRFDRSACPIMPDRYMNAIPAGGAVTVQGIGRKDIAVRFIETDFLNNEAQAGGAVALIDVASIETLDCDFRQNQADLGGAVLLHTSSQTPLTLSTIAESIFTNNAACRGGAIYASAPTRKNSQAGPLSSVNVQFMNNFAKTSGAVLHITSEPDAVSICCNCPDGTNHTLDADFVESLPGECESLIQGNQVGDAGYAPLFSTDRGKLEVSPAAVTRHRSGRVLPPIKVQNLDYLHQMVPDETVQFVIVAEGAVLEGEDHAELIDGAAIFDGLFLSALPGIHSIFIFQNDEQVAEIPVTVQKCLLNERIEDLVCVPCEEGSFPRGAAETCKPCPDHATCSDGIVLPEEGYWNADEDSTKILKCVRADACRTDPEFDPAAIQQVDPAQSSPNYLCTEGYEGTLCVACRDGYGHVRAQECEKCNRGKSQGFAVLLVLLLFFVVMLLTKSSWVYDFKTEPSVPQVTERVANSAADASSILCDMDIEAKPIPEHLEPAPSFGIHTSLKELLRSNTDLPTATTSHEMEEEPRVASASQGRTSPALAALPDEAATSSQSMNEITLDTEPALQKSAFQPLSIEAPEPLDETHVLMKPLLAEALKILITFVQTVSLALYIQIEWGTSARRFLSLLDFLGTGSSPYASMECLFDEQNDVPPSIQAFTFVLLIPVFTAVVFICVWLMFCLVERSLPVMWQRIKNSLVAVFYVSFLPVCHTSFRIMNCSSIELSPSQEEHYVWLEDSNVTCFEGPHRRLLFFLCVPLLSLTVVVYPFCFMMFLLVHKNLGKTERLRSWGLLFEAYKYKRRAWEFVIFVRRLLLAAVFAFGYHYSILVQTLVAIGITVMSLLVHSITSPYEKPERMLSQMETISLSGAFLVYFAACLIHALDYGRNAISVVLCVVLILVVLRLLYGFTQHLIRTIDWTLGEFGKENYYSKPWMVKLLIVCYLKCSFYRSRAQRVLKRWVAARS